MNKIASMVLSLGLTLLLGACATIMQGSEQQVAFSSSPSGAFVTVNGRSLGKTPLVTDLKRKDTHMIRIELDGYQPYETALTRSPSGWVFGNIVFGGIPGLIVDFATGALYKLSPDQVSGNLAQGLELLEGTDDVLVVTVVMHADPRWEKVGQLLRE